MACSHKHCSYEHTTGNFRSVVDLNVAVGSIKPLDVEIETQECFYFALFLAKSYFYCSQQHKCRLLVKKPIFLSDFKPNLEFLDRFSGKFPVSNFK